MIAPHNYAQNMCLVDPMLTHLIPEVNQKGQRYIWTCTANYLVQKPKATGQTTKLSAIRLLDYSKTFQKIPKHSKIILLCQKW